MGYMYLVYSFTAKNGHGTAELCGPNLTYWEEGNKLFDGSIDEFAIQFPAQFAELLEQKVIRKVGNE